MDAVTKKRLDLARKLYRERVRSLNSMSKLDPLHREAMDCDEIRAKRRMTAAVNLFDDVAAVARPICPDVEGVSDFEYEWLAHNMMPRISFDWNERDCNTVLAAALWILDQLREYGCFNDACLLFPQDERIFEELDLPPVEATVTGTGVLGAAGDVSTYPVYLTFEAPEGVLLGMHATVEGME